MHTRSVTGAVAAAAALIALYTTGAQGAVVELVLKPCEPGVAQQNGGAKLHVVDGNATFTTQRGQAVDLTTQDLLTVDCNGNAIKTAQNGTILDFAATGSITTASGGGGGTTGSLGQNGGNNGGGGGNNTAATPTNPELTGGSPVSSGPQSP